MSDTTLECILKHLVTDEFEVFESDNPGSIDVYNEKYGNITIGRVNELLISFQMYYQVEINSKDDRYFCLESINELNMNSSVGTYSLVQNKHGINLINYVGSYFGEYRLPEFGYFAVNFTEAARPEIKKHPKLIDIMVL